MTTTDFSTEAPPPEWVTPPPPWTPLPPPVDFTPPPPPPPRRRGSAALVALAVVLAAFGGGVIGRRLSLHGSRPTLATSSQPPDASFVPVSPPSSSPGAPSDSGGGAGSGTNGGGAGSASANAVATLVNPAVVDINDVIGYQGGQAAGTGMIIGSNGLVLTNNHVIDGATSITVTLVTTGRTYKANVVGTNPTSDVAVLQLQGASGLPTIQTATTTAVGDSVIAIGNAGGQGGAPSVVTGNVQALNQTITASDNNGANAETLNGLIETDAPLQPGDSGGPLVNTSGKVVGMNTAASSGRRFSAGSTVGFAIPINQALGIAQQIESGKASSTIHIGVPGFLGVSISRTATTALVAGVAPGTPAANAGIAQGDTITSVGGQTIDSPTTLTTVMRTHRPGEKVRVTWTDQSGSTHSATITLAAGPAD